MTTLEKRLRRSGALITVGLVIEFISLVGSRPTPFYFFLFAGGALVAGVGMILYLLALVGRTD